MISRPIYRLVIQPMLHCHVPLFSLLILSLLFPVLLYAQPIKLTVTSITPVSPQGGQSFAVTVQSQNAGGTPVAVTQATTVGLTWDSALLFLTSGSTQATISTGESSTTITLTLYSPGAITTPLHVIAPDANLASTSATLSMQANCTDYALSLNNSVAYVQDPGPSPLDITGSMTLETWFYHSTRNEGNWWDGQELAGKAQDNTDGFYSLFYNGGGSYSFWLRFDGGNFAGAEIPAALVNLNQWYHLAGVYNEATRTVTLYLNGEVAAVKSVPAGYTRNNTNNHNFELGRMPAYGGYLFNGRLSETRLWNVARSQEAIQDAMFTRLAPGTSGLAGYWRLDEGSGTTAFDLSGNNLHATVQSSPGYTTVESHPLSIKGRNVVFQNSTGNEYALPDFPGAVFQWIVTGGTITAGATSAEATINWGASTSGSVSATATKADGCTFSTTMTVAIIPGGGCDNNAVTFDGNDDYISAPGFSWNSGGPITIEFWTKVNSGEVQASSGFQIGSEDPGNRIQVHLPWTDNNLYWDYGDIGSTGRSVADFSNYLDKWTHVALVSAGSNGNFRGIYINGTLITSSTSSDGPNYALTGLTIGKLPFRGSIDEFRIWDTTRTEAQIRGNMYNRFSSPQPHLAGYWRLDEGTGTTTYDFSGYNNHGTLVDGPAFITSASLSLPISSSEGCAWTTQSYSVNAITSATYSWTATGGTITAGGTSSTVTVEWGAAGSGSVVVTVATLDGCALTTGSTISIYTPLVATAGTATAICMGESIALGGTPTASGGSGSYTYMWSPTTGLDNPTIANPIATPGTTTTYTVTVTGGCQVSSTVTVTVRPLAAPVLSLDGNNDYAQSTTAVNFANSSFTVELRAKRTSSGSEDFILSQGSENVNTGLHIGFRDNNDFAFAFYGNDLDISSAYSDNNWHHWACVYDISTGERRVYRDGELVGSQTNVNAYQGSGPLIIGNSVWFGSPYGGYVDELRIWNTARSQSEISDNLSSRLSGTENGLIAYYPFEEGLGTITTGATVSTPAATLFNGAAWVSSPSIYGTGIACSLPADFTYSVTPSSGNNYTWTVTGGTIIASTATTTKNSITVRWSVQTTGTVSVHAATAFCEASETIIVNVTNSTLVANGGSNATVCRGSGVAIGGSPTASNGHGSYTYVWSPATGLDNPYAANPTASPSTTTTYTVTVSDLFCSAVSTVTVSVLPAPMQVLSVDGNGDYLSAPSAVWFNGDFTVEAWVYVRSYNNWSRMIDFGNGAGSDNVLIALTEGTSGTPIIQIYNEGNISGLTAPSPLPQNEWVHLAFTVTTDTVSMYKNGELWTSGTINIPRNVNRTTNYIGHSNWPDDDANAMFDELRFWNTARTQEQIQQAMMTPLAGNETGLVAYYPFSDTEPVYQDEGPNGYHLTAHGDVTRKTEAIITGTTSLCEFSTGATYRVLTTPGETYSWTAEAGTVVSATSGSVVVNWGTTGTHTLVVTAANAQCSGTGSIDIEVRSYPVAAISGTTAVCPQSAVQYSVTPVANATYAWTVNGGVITAGQTSATVTVLWGDTGTGDLGTMITSQYGCASATTQTIIIQSRPAQVAITGNNDICVNSTGLTYTAPGTPGNSYMWSVNGGVLTSGQSGTTITVSWDSPGMNSVIFTETMPNGCSSSTTLSVKVSAEPFASGNNLCFTGWQYQQPLAVTNADNQPLTNYYALVTINTLSLISQGKMRADGADIRFSDNDGCTELDYWIDNGLNTERTVIWVKIPVVEAHTSRAIALLYGNPGASTSASIADLFHPGLAALYTFTEGSDTTIVDKAGNFDLSVTGSLNWQPGFRAGTYSVSNFQAGRAFYNGTGPAIGTGDFTTVAFIYPANPDGNTQGIIGNYYSDGVNGWTLKLQGGQGRMMLLTSQGGNFCQDPLAGTLQPNTWAMVAGRRVSGVNNSLFQNGTRLTDLCGGTTRNIDNSGPFEIGHSYNGQYAFNGRIAFAAVYSTALPDSAIQQLYQSLFPAVPPTLTFGDEEQRGRLIAGDTVSCNSAVASYFIPLLSGTAELFQWSVTGGVIAGSSTGNTITVVWSAGTSGTLTVTATNATAGCTGSTSLSVRLIPTPDAIAISGEVVVCPVSAEDTGEYIYTTSLQSDQSLGWMYSWTVTGGTITAGQGTSTATVVWNTPGTGTIALTQTNMYHCIAVTTATITVQPVVVADAGANANICYGESIALGGAPTASGGTGGYTYLWTASDMTIAGISDSTSANPVVWPTSTATYTVLITDSFGCRQSTSVTITVNALPAPALSFDGIDDYFAFPLPNAQTDDITLEAMIQWNGKSGNNPIISVGSGDTNGFVLQYNHPVLSLYCPGAGTVSGTVPNSTLEFIQDNWIHVAAVRNTGTWTLYVAGDSLATTGNPVPVIPTDSVHVGSDQNGDENFGGMIGHVRMWTTARTGEQIAGSSYGPISGSQTGLAAYYRLDEGTGTTVADAVGGSAMFQPRSTGPVWKNDLKIYGSDVVCAYSTTSSYIVMPGTIKANTAYSWSLSSGGTITGTYDQATFHAIMTAWSGSGTETVSVTATSPEGCSVTTTFTVSVNSQPTLAAVSNQTTIEDAATTLTVSIGDLETHPSSLTVTVTSGDTTLLPASGIVVSQTGATRSITLTPSTNAHGSVPVTVTVSDQCENNTTTAVFTLTVLPANDAPSFVKGSDQTALEDAGAQTVTGWATSISAGPVDEFQSVSFTVSNDNNALFSVQPAVSSSGTLTFTPAPNMNGSAIVSVYLADNGGTTNGGVNTSATVTFTINITPVNDAPSFTKGADQTVPEDAGAQSVTGWATNISTGAADEVQSLSFTISNDNNALFSVQPAVSPNGTLTFTPALHMYGSAVVSLYLSDNGGTANSGVNTSATVTFTINVTPVNDAPSFTKGDDQTVLEDAGAQTVAGWATSISAGPVNELQSVSFVASNNNTALFSVQPAVSSTGTLTFTPAPNMNGSAIVSLYLSDNGGTTNGGVNTSATVTFTINITPVNDAPSFTKGADQTVPEDAGAQTVTGWATNISTGAANEVQSLSFTISNDNNTLFSVQPAVSSNGTLTFTPALHMYGSAVVSLYLSDNGGTANGGANTSTTATFTINVTPVNDAPIVTGDTAATCYATSVDIAPLGNDSDVENDVLSIGSVTQGANGSVVLLAGDTSVSYTPNNGFFGTDSFTYTAIDGNGGSSTTTISVEVYPPVTVGAGADTTICAGQSIRLEGTGTSFLGGLTFQWTPATGLSNAAIAMPNASPSTTTTYTLTVTDGFGCSVSDQVTITVAPLPDVQISSNASICAGGSVQLVAGGGTNYAWSPATGLDNPFIANPIASPSTTTTYTVVISTGDCSVEGQVTVTVEALPAASAGEDVTICAGTTVQLQAGGGTSYTWSPSAGLDNPFIANPTASPSATTTYIVTIGNDQGCSATDTVVVNVTPLTLGATVMLEGAFEDRWMHTNLIEQGLLPAQQPYNTAPFFYNGTEQIATSATSVVDWVLVELRTQESPSSTVLRRAALLYDNGWIAETDGSYIALSGITPADSGYYLVVWHRNHVAVMSAAKLLPDAGCRLVYNFSASDAAAYSMFQSGQKPISSEYGTFYSMVAGDINHDGIVNAADRAEVRNDAGRLGYLNTDVSLDGIVNAVDRVLVRNNTFRVSQVP